MMIKKKKGNLLDEHISVYINLARCADLVAKVKQADKTDKIFQP